MKENAFTLAEVLITLGIIGVVAALVLPPLIANHRKHVVETYLKRFYSNMNQAIKMSEVEHGEDAKYWPIPQTNSEAVVMTWYDEYLKKYLITTKVSYENDRLKIFFPDGSVDIVTYGVSDHSYCINAGKTSASDYGKNCFAFMFYPNISNGTPAHEDYRNKLFEPYLNYSWDGTREGLKTFTWMYTKLIQLNDWKIPDDYPVKF